MGCDVALGDAEGVVLGCVVGLLAAAELGLAEADGAAEGFTAGLRVNEGCGTGLRVAVGVAVGAVEGEGLALATGGRTGAGVDSGRVERTTGASASTGPEARGVLLGTGCKRKSPTD